MGWEGAFHWVVKRLDPQEAETLATNFRCRGIPDLFPVSAEHAMGIEALLDHVAADFPAEEPEETEPVDTRPIKVAIIGRPNTGKSTLLNAVTGEERAIVSPIAGTTHDAVDET